MPIVSIPILDRLSFRDYQSVFITIIFFTCESILRVILMFMPKFLIRQMDALIEANFPWLSRAEAKPHVSPLEHAETFEKMVKHWKNYNCEQHVVLTKDNYLLCVHRIPSVKTEHRKVKKFEPQEEIPSPLAYVKSIGKWEHLDFLWAEGVENIIYPDIIKLLERFNPHINAPVAQKEGVKNDPEEQVLHINK
ncbi:hypothetical protein RMCBS344292_11303 [Rhizopus microsporus]|nr:hypothetical protein RMCBS344292_11303 [Rhizopus microsporus]